MLNLITGAIMRVAGQGCTAAYYVARAASVIYGVGRRSAPVYYADRSTFQLSSGFNSCTIDITVGERGQTERYVGDYRFCGPTW